MPVQLRYAIKLTGEQYVSSKAWQQANLPSCPVHRGVTCGFARHGTYERKLPPGTRVARWYCRLAHCTFSLLADCFASGLPGTLVEIEEVVLGVEQAPSQEKAADSIRTEIELAGALRWMRRRLCLIRAALITLVGLMPELLVGARPTIMHFRRALGVEPVLPELREIAASYLASLPPPLGFGPRPQRAPPPRHALQQSMGTDAGRERS
jgi:hypothetical protein